MACTGGMGGVGRMGGMGRMAKMVGSARVDGVGDEQDARGCVGWVGCVRRGGIGK